MIPVPLINFIRKAYVEAAEPRMFAFTNKVDKILTEIFNDIKRIENWNDPSRMPSQFLDEMAYLLGGYLTGYKENFQIRAKREFVATAIQLIGKAGDWDYIKPVIDAITGYSASIYTGAIDPNLWIEIDPNDTELVQMNPTPPPPYLIDEGYSGEATPPDLGMYEMGTGLEVQTAGNIYIDLGDGGSLPLELLQLVIDFFTVDMKFAYYIITLGFVSGDNFYKYEVIR